jgi:hypothetical protein
MAEQKQQASLTGWLAEAETYLRSKGWTPDSVDARGLPTFQDPLADTTGGVKKVPIQQQKTGRTIEVFRPVRTREVAVTGRDGKRTVWEQAITTRPVWSFPLEEAYAMQQTRDRDAVKAAAEASQTPAPADQRKAQENQRIAEGLRNKQVS